MNARTFLPIFLVLFLVGGVLSLTAPAGGGRSITDRTAKGYRAAYAWLSTQGEVLPWSQPLEDLGQLPTNSTLLIVWPLARPLDSAADAATLLHWISQGNRAVFALDGSSTVEPPIALIDDALGAVVTREAPDPPWWWTDWLAWETERQRAAGEFGSIEAASPEWWITCPGEVIAAASDGRARVCRIPRGKGEAIVVMDATLWQNDHLARADNAALLRHLFAGRRVYVDEWHQDATQVVSTTPAWIPALLFAHLGFAWLVSGTTLARRFGDPLPPPAIARTSMATSLHALASLHRGAGHAAAAGARLLTLVRARGNRRGVDPATFPAPPNDGDAGFARWARQISELQREHRL